MAPFAAGADLGRLSEEAAAGARGAERLTPGVVGTDAFLSSPHTGTTPSGGAAASPLAPVLQGEGAEVKSEPAAAVHPVTASPPVNRRPALLIALGFVGGRSWQA